LCCFPFQAPAPRTGNFIIQNSDVILVLGNSLSFRQTGYAQDKFAPDAKILWVDIDENEAKKPGMQVELFVKCELNRFFDLCKSIQVDSQLSASWIGYCEHLRERFTPYESIEPINAVDLNERVNSYYFWKMYDAFAGEDNVIAMGNSRANAAKIQIGVKKKNQRAITNYLCGSMGYDLPAAIGCAVASKKEVICVTGDGSIMMNLQELQTISHNHLPVKVVVFSNDGYEAIRQTHKNFFNGVFLGCTPESGISFPDFESLAKAFNFKYDICRNNGEVREKIKWLMDSTENVFLEVLQLIENPILPKVTSRIKEDGSFETPALHDMMPFLSREEVDQLMIHDRK